MDPTKEKRDLARLFQEAGRAHHLAFLATNGEDPDWPRWYAEYLRPELARFGLNLTVDELARLLEEVEERRQSERPYPDWPFYYATFFLDGVRVA
jgi:hypothetical protein